MTDTINAEQLGPDDGAPELEREPADATPDPDQDDRDDQEPERPEPRGAGRKPKGMDTIEEFMDRLAGHSSEGTVQVHRHKRGGGTELIGKYDVTDFDLEDVKAVYGGGKFRLLVTDARGDYAFTRTVEVAGKPRQPDLDGESRQESEMLQTVRELGRRIDSIADRVRNHPPEAQGRNPFELALALSEYTTQQTKPLMDTLLALLTEKQKGAGGGGDSSVDILLKGMELARDLQPPSDPMVPVLTQMALPLLQQLGQNMPKQPETPAPNPPEQEPDASSSRRPAWDVLLAPWLKNLQSWASREKDPVVRATFVVDEIPDEAVQMIGEQLERGESFLAEFFQLHPETKTYAEWYRTFWAAIGAQIEWDDDEADDSDQEQEQDGNGSQSRGE